jgi:glycosyltransferase involved in cell wall biosynthesis
MTPLFAAMAAPVLKPRGIRTVLWYTHPSGSFTLRLAEKLVDRIFTTAAETFPLASAKVVITGHGIDTGMFSPGARRSSGETFNVLSAGRLAPVKRLEMLVEALRLLRRDGVPAETTFVGPVLPGNEGYAERLRREIAEAGLEDSVELVGPAPPRSMANFYRRSDALVSTTETGSADKSVLEAMSCGVPVVATNEVFARMVRTVSPEIGRVTRNAGEVAARLRAIWALEADQRRALGEKLRELVIRHHSLDRVVDQVAAHLHTRDGYLPKVAG